jgi:hypothetical protein
MKKIPESKLKEFQQAVNDLNSRPDWGSVSLIYKKANGQPCYVLLRENSSLEKDLLEAERVNHE